MNTDPMRAAVTGIETGVADAFRSDDHSLDDLPIGVLVFLDGEVVRVNDGWRALTGLDLEGSRGTQWLAAVHRDDRALAESVPRLAFGGTDAAGDWRLLRERRSAHSGAPDLVAPDHVARDQVDPDHVEPKSPEPKCVDEVWVHARVRHARSVNVRTCVVTLTEIATHKANELRLLHLAMHDALTGLPNRDAFVERVDVSLTRAARDHVTALLFVDLDRFKQVNDSHGHSCGDKLLTSVAHRIRSTLRPFDTLGRLGGDEFAIVCEVASAHDAGKLAQRIVDAVAHPFEIDDESITVGASIGVATAMPEAATSHQLIARADEAMYRAKEAGGARWWMPGERDADTEAGPRLARADADAALAQIIADISRLQQRSSELHGETVHLGDDPLTRRVADIAAALGATMRVAGCPARR